MCHRTKKQHRAQDKLDNHISLSALLEQDLSSYEYFYSLPADIQQKIAEKDPTSFEELQEYAAKLRKKHEETSASL